MLPIQILIIFQRILLYINEEIYYVDFECNDYMEEWNFENWGVKYWSKTPEFLQYVNEHS